VAKFARDYAEHEPKDNAITEIGAATVFHAHHLGELVWITTTMGVFWRCTDVIGGLTLLLLTALIAGGEWYS